MPQLQVAGVRGRRPERTAGDLPVRTPKVMEMRAKKRKAPKNVLHHKGWPDRKPALIIFIHFLINTGVKRCFFSVSCN